MIQYTSPHDAYRIVLSYLYSGIYLNFVQFFKKLYPFMNKQEHLLQYAKHFLEILLEHVQSHLLNILIIEFPIK